MKLYNSNILMWPKLSILFMLLLVLAWGCSDDDDGPEAPFITSLNPDSSLPGTDISITGRNFGTDASATIVNFGTTAATINNISATLINVTVPENLPAGDITITITLGGQKSNEVSFEVAAIPTPTITSIAPNEGLPGASVTITGANFGETTEDNEISFGDEKATIINASATEITTQIPDIEAGEVQVSVTANDLTSNTVAFTVVRPSITNVNPASGSVGSEVVINGNNFSTTLTENVVTFGDESVLVTNATTTALTVTVPANLSLGISPVVVMVNGVQASSITDISFTVIGPSATSINPMSGPAGSVVIINGTNFSTTNSQNVVMFGNETAMVTNATVATLTVTVPENLPPGTVPVTVVVNGTQASGDISFGVIVPVSPLYWVEQEASGPYKIIKGEIDGDGNRQTATVHSATGTETIAGLAVDTQSQEVYWVEEYESGFSTIRSSSDSIYSTTDLSFNLISSFAVDGINDRLFWVEEDFFTFPIARKIWTSNTDGTNLNELFAGETFQTIAGMELDPANQKAYFIEDFEDGVANTNSRVFEGLYDGTALNMVYQQSMDLPAGSNISGFVDLAVSGSSIYIAGTQQIGSISQILRGSLDGNDPLTVVYESQLGTNNPMTRLLGLTVDRTSDYLYWINYGDATDPLNSTIGSIYRGPADASLVPELLFENLSLPSRTNPVKNGRQKNRRTRTISNITF